MAKRKVPTGKVLDQAVIVVKQFIKAGATPGAAVLVGRHDRIVLDRGLGHLSYRDDAPPVTSETIYDLASLTKVLVTTTLAMLYYERGLLDLDGPVKDYIAEFHGGDKDQVRIKDLLAHCSGLVWWADLHKRFEGKTPDETKVKYLQAICEMPLNYPPRTRAVYSDLGFILLGEILERIGKEQLDTLAKTCIFEPLGMSETTFRPRFSDNIAPTEEDEWRGRTVQGEVHDENAHAMGGVAGHAGLFSTAQDLAVLGGLLTNRGMLEMCDFEPRSGVPCGARSTPIRTRFLDEETIRRFTARAGLESSRALGWDTPSGQSSSGDYFSAQSYGHTGFTGTSIWIDPELDLFVILLTNRVNPTRDHTRHIPFRRAVHDLAIAAISDREISPRDSR